MKSRVIHLKGLNGIRAIASLSVVFFHLSIDLDLFGLDQSMVFSRTTDGKVQVLNMGIYGVSMFFTLSGFLITYLLLIEKEKLKTINIKKFYIRRILRIWPLYYLYLILAFISFYYFNINFDSNMVPFYLLLTANIPLILGKSLKLIYHYWSIGVEEQFYLFWPWIAKLKLSKIYLYSILFIFLTILLKIVFKILILLGYNYNLLLIILSVNKFHLLIIGSLGALLYYERSRFITIFTNKITQVICWSILILALINKFHISSDHLDNEIISVVTLFIIFAQIERRNFIIDLDNKISDFIGKISYGIYVYHPLIIFLTYKAIGKFKTQAMTNYIFIYFLIISLTVLVSWVSYEFFEARFIKMKTKFQIAKSSS